MATKEQIAALFVYEQGHYKIIGRGDEFSVRIFGSADFAEIVGPGVDTPDSCLVYSHSRESAEVSTHLQGEYRDLEAAQRACLKLAGIDPDASPEGQSAPSPH